MCCRNLFDVRSMKEFNFSPMFESCEQPKLLAAAEFFEPLVNRRAEKNERSEYRLQFRKSLL